MTRGTASADAVLGLFPYLRALASPIRLQLLWQLRVPKNLGQLRVQASDKWGRLREDRALSRSTVQEHLSLLEEHGLVQRVPDMEAYVVDRQRLFRVAQDVGALAQLRPLLETDVSRTIEAPPRPRTRCPRGPSSSSSTARTWGRRSPCAARGRGASGGARPRRCGWPTTPT